MAATPTEEQMLALRVVCDEGLNAVVHAPPGTGKTFCIMEAARRVCQADADATILICAYNTELAAEVSAAVELADLSARVSCYTFHGLCSNTIILAADDAALEDAIAYARVDLENRAKRLACTHVFIDECQDMTDLHKQLLAIVIDKNSVRQYMLVGDVDQLLYNYGHYPSRVGFLTSPEEHFKTQRPWRRVRLSHSMRITAPMARLVDAHFETGLKSRKEHTSSTHPVHIYGSNKWKISEVIVDILKRQPKTQPLEAVSILVAAKASNGPFRIALNDVSASGFPMYVHGIDGSCDSVRKGKIRVSSFHASKGTEGATAIVILPNKIKRNPFYVGITRATRELHVILVKDAFDADVCRTLLELSEEEGIVRFENPLARQICTKAMNTPPECTENASGGTAEEQPVRPSIRSLDHGRSASLPTIRGTTRKHGVHTITNIDVVVGVHGSRNFENVSAVYARAVLMKLEHACTGRIRAMDDIVTPSRLEFSKQEVAIRHGHVGRFVSPFVSEESLLARDLTHHAIVARNKASSARDWCTMAASFLSWNGYHHVFRQLIPFDWVDETLFDMAFANAQAGLAEADSTLIRFDTRLSRQVDGTLLHARVHASSDACAWHFSWGDIGSKERTEAVLRATLHRARMCRLIALTTGECMEISARGMEEVIVSRIFDEE